MNWDDRATSMAARLREAAAKNGPDARLMQEAAVLLEQLDHDLFNAWCEADEQDL